MSLVKSFFEKIIFIIPYIGKWRKVFLKHSTPGHFYSPIPDADFIENRKNIIFNANRSVKGIDFNENYQLTLIKNISPILKEYPFPEIKISELLFYNQNIYYFNSDAVCLYGMIRHFKPKRIIEIGSGFSSALILDVNRLYFNYEINLTFIEPNPERLKSIVGFNENFELIENIIQDVDIDKFRNLESGDFLFIDSSHVSKAGSDLNHIIFEILPILNKGVIIHFHDIFYPFEYPYKWIKKGYYWNENYIIRSLLMYSRKFEIILMNTFLALIEFADVPNMVKEINKNEQYSGSIWLRIIE